MDQDKEKCVTSFWSLHLVTRGSDLGPGGCKGTWQDGRGLEGGLEGLHCEDEVKLGADYDCLHSVKMKFGSGKYLSMLRCTDALYKLF